MTYKVRRSGTITVIALLILFAMVLLPPTVYNDRYGPVFNGYQFIWESGQIDVARLVAQILVLLAATWAVMYPTLRPSDRP